MKGFSQSLMQKILVINQQVASLESAAQSLQDLLESAPKIKEGAQGANNSPGKILNIEKQVERLQMLREGMVERVSTVQVMEGCPAKIEGLRGGERAQDAQELAQECQVLESGLVTVSREHGESRRL